MSSRRRWLVLILAAMLIGLVGAVYALPGLVRRVAIARIQASTNRHAAIDGLDLHLLTGRLTLRGFHLAERDSEAPFADFQQLDLRLDLLSLLRGHLRIADAVLRNPTVHVVRLAEGFNFSDLIQGSGTTRRAFDVTVERFALHGGTVTLEDRSLPGGPTWTSDQIEIEAQNVSTRRDDGRAVATSVTAGTPTRLEIENLRLYPIHLRATATVQGMDLTLSRLYLPPDLPILLDHGRLSSSLSVTLDARTGVRADGTGELEDVVLLRRGERDPAARVPSLKTRLTGLAYQDGRLQLARFDLEGSASVRDPRAGARARYQLSTVQASIADLTWPVTAPARIDVRTAIPQGGTLTVSGAVQPPPAPSQLRLRLAHLDLTPWAQFLPTAARITGFGEADLRIDEPIAAGVPTRVSGSVAVSRLAVSDGRQALLAARRVEASGLAIHWPTRVTAARLLVAEPRGVVERASDGSFPLRGLLTPPPAAPGPSPVAGPTSSSAPLVSLDIGEIVVRGGRLAWRDQAVTPPVALDFSRIETRVTGAGWPLRGPLHVRAAVHPPAGGEVQVAGRVAVEPVTAELRVTSKATEIGPYQAYVPTAAHLSGRADLDVAVVLPPSWPEGASVRGTAALSGLDARDEERTVMRLERGTATGLDIEWPRRATVGELVLQRPWILLERDETGALPLRGLLTTRATARSATAASAGVREGAPERSADGGGQAIPVALGRLVVEDGGARVVDRSISPAFAVDLRRLTGQVEGLSTSRAAKPAGIELTGRAADDTRLSVRGTIGALGGPLRLDMNADVRSFAMPRTNPYLLRYVAWEARDGWLSTSLQCRIDGDALEARTDIQLSRLQVARASNEDEVQARLGLPLGMIVALMKDRRGNINLSLPVGGRLNDPRFDFSEAIWSTVRNVAVKAITAPVSWIGRVHTGADSRIERIDIDPIPFQTGTATLTPDGQEQVTRVAAFLSHLPEVRLALTPVLSAQDLAELRRRRVDAAIDRLVREGGTPSDAAAARLFRERFPGRPLPDAPDAVRAALAEGEPVPPDVAAALATQRVETVRAMIAKAGGDPGRLTETAIRDEGGAPVEGQVKLDLVEATGNPGRPGGKAS